VLKRVVIIGVLAMSLVSMAGITVEAQSIGGFLVIGINSVEVESILKQLKNAAKTGPLYEVVMFLQEVSVTCKNPAGQTGEANSGEPFELNNVAVSETDTIGADQITKNGRALSEIIFSNDELAAALATARGAVCKKNWTADKIVVNAMEVVGTLFSCPADGACEFADALGKQCFAPAGQDLFSTTFEYNCSTTCVGEACL
jgi:hypothetical protein